MLNFAELVVLRNQLIALSVSWQTADLLKAVIVINNCLLLRTVKCGEMTRSSEANIIEMQMQIFKGSNLVTNKFYTCIYSEI